MFEISKWKLLYGWSQGTTFVLQKNIGPQQRLLQAISVGQGVEEVAFYLGMHIFYAHDSFTY
jgi:hypothetical protein